MKKGKRKKQRVHELVSENHETSGDEEENFYVESITTVDSIGDSRDEIRSTLIVNSQEVTLKIDTGARCNVLPLETIEKINATEKIKLNLKAYGGAVVKTVGTARLPVVANNRECEMAFYVVAGKYMSIISLVDSVKLNLLKINDNMVHIVSPEIVPEFEENPDLFDEETVGELPVKYKMTLDPSVPPVIRPPRRVPKPMEGKVKEELRRMTKLGVIEPVEEATEWVLSMVATNKKSGEIRLCIDPRDLNRALLRPHHPMRTVEEITMNLADATVFIVLDAKTSFWQIKLGDESSNLTCFNSPLARHKFLQMYRLGLSQMQRQFVVDQPVIHSFQFQTEAFLNDLNVPMRNHQRRVISIKKQFTINSRNHINDIDKEQQRPKY